jgi:hypothetical protein
MHIWPVRFPAHTEVRAVIEATPRAYIAQVQEGQLSLDAAWLPEADAAPQSVVRAEGFLHVGDAQVLVMQGRDQEHLGHQRCRLAVVVGYGL